MKPIYTVWFFACAMAYPQQRIIVSPKNEVLPLNRAKNAGEFVNRRGFNATGGSPCGPRFTFGYDPLKFPPTSNVGSRHKDVLGEWFVAPASGTIDAIFWENLGSVGAHDSLLSVRIFNSNIYPGRGPGVAPYPAPCTPWGYYRNTNDLDQGITPFRNEATDTTWISSVYSDSTSFDPLGDELWGNGGFFHKMKANAVNFIPLDTLGETLRVQTGDQFFITMRVNSLNQHPDPPDYRTEFTAWGSRVTLTDEQFPSRDWKFYEHDSGPSNCSGHNTNLLPKGWIARGGFGDDTLDVAAWNIWYTMMVTSNVPPHVEGTTELLNTFDEGPFVVEAIIQDCDPPDPSHAGIDHAEILWSLDGNPQPDIPMVSTGGDTWEATLPAQSCIHTITYKVRATDRQGLAGFGSHNAFTIVCFSTSYYTPDTGATCKNQDISSTGTIIPDCAFFLPRSAPPNILTTDNGTSGPFDIGGNMKLFCHDVRYAWIGINGALGLSKSITDTLDMNSNGRFSTSWTFPYSKPLRTQRDTSSIVMGYMPTNFIAPFWYDLLLSTSTGIQFGNIRYEKYPHGDTCLFVVEWDSLNVPICQIANCQPDESKLRVVLNRCDGTIEFQYDKIDYYSYDSLVLIGMQGKTNAEYYYLHRAGAPAETRPRDNWCVKLYPSGITAALDESNVIPRAFALYQNYPNPFNPTTDIGYQIPEASHVTLKIFDVLGREIATLVNEKKAAGVYTVTWDAHQTDGGQASSLPSGVYFYRLRTEKNSADHKMVLIR